NATAQCGASPAPAGAGAAPAEDCAAVLAPPVPNGAHAVRDIRSLLKQLADAPKLWCSRNPASADDRRPSLRAFVHPIYDYRCQYRRAVAAAGSTDDLVIPGPDGETSKAELSAADAEIGKEAKDIFAACGVEVPVFADEGWTASCNGAIPKSIP